MKDVDAAERIANAKRAVANWRRRHHDVNAKSVFTTEHEWILTYGDWPAELTVFVDAVTGTVSLPSDQIPNAPGDYD